MGGRLLLILKYWPSGQHITIKINFCFGRNISLAREVTLFLLLVSSSKPLTKRNRFKCMYMVDFVYGFIFVVFFKHFAIKKVKEKFTWIASALALIYLHLLSRPEQLHAENYLTKSVKFMYSSNWRRELIDSHGFAIINARMFVQIHSM